RFLDVAVAFLSDPGVWVGLHLSFLDVQKDKAAMARDGGEGLLGAGAAFGTAEQNPGSRVIVFGRGRLAGFLAPDFIHRLPLRARVGGCNQRNWRGCRAEKSRTQKNRQKSEALQSCHD